MSGKLISVTESNVETTGMAPTEEQLEILARNAQGHFPCPDPVAHAAIHAAIHWPAPPRGCGHNGHADQLCSDCRW